MGTGLPAMAIGIYTTLFSVCVHIHCCGNGHLGFRPYGGSLWRSAKVSKTLLPYHSVPRLGSACPQAGIAPWARRDRPSMAVSRLPRHPCRGAHCAIPACGHRGLTGRLRSKPGQQQSQSAKLHSPVGAGLPAMTPERTHQSIWYSFVIVNDHRRQASSHILISVQLGNRIDQHADVRRGRHQPRRHPYAGTKRRATAQGGKQVVLS